MKRSSLYLTAILAALLLIQPACRESNLDPRPDWSSNSYPAEDRADKIDTVEITNDNFDQIVLQSDELVLLDFWAQWCAPCRVIGPVIDRLANEYADQIVVGKVNIDDQPDLASQFEISSIPMLIFLRDGEAVLQLRGLQSYEDLKEQITRLLDE